MLKLKIAFIHLLITGYISHIYGCKILVTTYNNALEHMMY